MSHVLEEELFSSLFTSLGAFILERRELAVDR